MINQLTIESLTDKCYIYCQTMPKSIWIEKIDYYNCSPDSVVIKLVRWSNRTTNPQVFEVKDTYSANGYMLDGDDFAGFYLHACKIKDAYIPENFRITITYEIQVMQEQSV